MRNTTECGKRGYPFCHTLLCTFLCFVFFCVPRVALADEFVKSVDNWADLKKALEDPNGSLKIVLAKNITAGDNAAYITIKREVTLDLCGHTLDRNLSGLPSDEWTSECSALQVGTGANLTLMNSKGTGQVGIVKGGAALYGGGIYVYGNSTLTVENGVNISGNKAQYGGGIFVSNGYVYLNQGSVVSGNTANQGGGVYMGTGSTSPAGGNDYGSYKANVYLQGGSIQENSSATMKPGVTVSGGGIYMKTGVLTITSGRIYKNTTLEEPGNGAGIYQGGGTIEMSGGSIEENQTGSSGATVVDTSSYWGAGVFQSGGLFTLTEGEISDNVSQGRGGGFCQYPITNGCSFAMSGGCIKENVVKNTSASGGVNHEAFGGGIYQDSDLGKDSLANIKISGGSITGNTANDDYRCGGGGICTSRGTMEVSGCMISNNAAGVGGGVYLRKSSETMTLTLGANLVVSHNTGMETGGAVHADNVFIPNDSWHTNVYQRVVVATNAASNVGIRTVQNGAPSAEYTDFGIWAAEANGEFFVDGISSDFGDAYLAVSHGGLASLWKHTHTYECEAVGGDATQAKVRCTNDKCPYHDTDGRVILSAQDGTYDDTPHEASTSIVRVPQDSCDLELTYHEGRSATGEKLGSAPVDAGEYTAVVNVRCEGTNNANSTVVLQKTYETFTRKAEVHASDQAVIRGNIINQGANYASLVGKENSPWSGPVSGHMLTDVTLEPDDEVYEPGPITPSAARIFNPSGKDVTANYELTYVQGEITIVDVIPEYTPPEPITGLVYNGANQTLLKAGTSDEADILYSYSKKGTYTEFLPKKKDAGSYTVWYKVAAKKNASSRLSDIQPQSLTVTIAPLPVGLSWTNKSFTYNGELHKPTVSITNLISGEECDLVVEGAATNAGTHTAMVTSLSNPNYTLRGSSNTSCEFTIAKREVSVSGIQAQNKVYDGTADAMLDLSSVQFGAVSGDEGLIAGDDLALSAQGAFENANAGENKPVVLSDVTLTGASAENYELKGDPQAITATISQRPITIQAKDQVVTSVENIDKSVAAATLLPKDGYPLLGGHALETVGITEDTAASPNRIIVSTPTTIKSGTANVTSNYSIDYQPGTLTIQQNIPTFTPPAPYELTYNGNPQALVETGSVQGDGYTMKYALAEQGEYQDSAPEQTNAGVYTVYYQIFNNDGSAAVFSRPQSIKASIAKRPVTVVPGEGQHKTYGSTDPALTFSVENWHFGMDLVQGTLKRKAGDAAGTYAINAFETTSEQTNPNYIIRLDASKTFTIHRRPVTIAGITANSKTYDGTTVATVKGIATLENVLETDRVNLNLASYAVTFVTPDAGAEKDVLLQNIVLTGDAASNYTPRTNQTIPATISLREARISANSQTILAGTSIKQGTAYAWMHSVSGVAEPNGALAPSGPAAGQELADITLHPQEPVVDGGVIVPSDAVVEDAEGNDVTSNYALTYQNGMLIVLNVTPDYEAPVAQDGLVYNGKKQALLKDPGKVKGRKDAIIVYALSKDGEYSADVPRMKDAGTYQVWWKIVLSTDYDEPVGTLAPQCISNITIAPKKATVAWTNTEFWYDGLEHAPTATVTNLVEGDKCSVTVAGAQTKAGTYTATATLLSNPNYYLPENTTTEFTIRKATVSPKTKVVLVGGAPKTTSSNLDAVADSLVTDEERGLAANGAEFLVWLQVTKLADGSVSSADAAALKKQLESLGATAGTYLDISLFKTVGKETTRITKTPEAVQLAVTVPEGMRKSGRTFYLLRCHDGKADVVAQGTGNTLSGKSDGFSTYLIAYKDANGNSSSKNASGSNSLARTGDSAPTAAGLLALLGAALLAGGALRSSKHE